MVKNLNKRGQFYLIAAVLIIVVVFAIVNLRGYTSNSETLDLSYIVDELNIETGQVITYGVFNPTSGQTINDLINTWSDAYVSYSQGKVSETDWIFIYGNEEGVFEVITFTDTDSSIRLNIGGDTAQTNVRGLDKKKGSCDDLEKKCKVELSKLTITLSDGNTYDFELKQGENFFFVISREGEEERHIVTD